MPKTLRPVDLSGFEIRNVVAQNLAVAPEHAGDGTFYYNTTIHKFCVMEAGVWKTYATKEELINALGTIVSTYYVKTTNTINKNISILDTQVKENANEIAKKTVVSQEAVGTATISDGNGTITVYSVSKIGDLIEAIKQIPDVRGKSGKFLGTNGLTYEWMDLPEGTNATKGIVRFANDSEFEQGTSQDRAVVVKQVIDALRLKADLVYNGQKITGGTATNVHDAISEIVGQVNINSQSISGISLVNQSGDNTGTSTITVGNTSVSFYDTEKVKSLVSTLFRPKGSVNTYNDLPIASLNEIGDVWNIKNADPDHGINAGDNVVWVRDNPQSNGYWDNLSGIIDLSAYLTKTGAEEIYATKTYVDSLEVQYTHKAVLLNPALTPVGGVCTWEIIHSLGNDVVSILKDAVTGDEVWADIKQSNNLLTIKMNSQNVIDSETYKVVIIG